MIDLLSHLGQGFGVVFQFVEYKFTLFGDVHSIWVPWNILLCLIGAIVGTLIGVLPGVGPLATIAMLLPITFGLPPVGALIMLAGIYYGAQYGGSTTSILINIPGESSSVVTTLDGHQMARQGRAGPALAIAAIGSFFAGCVSTVLVAALGAPLTSLALLFGPAEYFSLMVLGLCFAVVLARGSILKALAHGGARPPDGDGRLRHRDRANRAWPSTFPNLSDGIGFVVVAMGVFGFAEIMRNLEQGGIARRPQGQVDRPDADLARSEGIGRPDRPRHHSRRRSSAFCRAAAPSSPRSRPTRFEKKICAIRRGSDAAPSKAWPRLKAPTTRRRRPRSSPCSRSVSRRTP